MRIGNDGGEAENAVAVYRLILLIRRFEEKAGQLYAMGLIPDEIKLCIGREALFAGVNAASNDGDPLLVGRRCHGALLALGLEPEVLMNELANPSRGLFDQPTHGSTPPAIRPTRFYYCPTDNGKRARWATSLAVAQSLKGTQNVAFVILDGDSLRGSQIVRTLLLAKRFQLQIVFIIDHAVPDPMPGQPGGDGPSSHLQKRVQASAISFTPVDGIDPQNVIAACQAAGDTARSGAGPQGLLVSTQAFRGHASQQTAGRRGPASQAVHDPVVIARMRLIDACNGQTETALAIEKDVRATLTTIGLNMRASAQL